MKAFQPVERSWEVDGLVLHGLEWGTPDARPVLALHGWQDNAASFHRIAPELHGCHVVAVDLTGHGLSDFRSADATYQIWDDIPQLAGVLDQLGWDRCALMGHSRGAIIASLWAAAQPARVTHLILLDAVMQQPVAEEKFSEQFALFLRDRESASGRRSRRYPSREAAVEARSRRGLSRAAAAVLAQRGLRGDDESGWEWRIDPRLRGASAVKLTSGQIQAVLRAIEAPALLLQAREGLMQHRGGAEQVRAHLPHLRVEYAEGGHHFHMDERVDTWAPKVLAFLEDN